MRAIRIHQYGGPEQLVLDQVPQPQVEPGTVLIRVRFAGVNPLDWKMRVGPYRNRRDLALPFVPGVDVAGSVEAVGDGVADFTPGDAVYALLPKGGYAEYALAPANAVAPKPRSLSFDEAASVPEGAMTAWRSLFDFVGLQAGQRLLIQGASGGVGLVAVQLAHWKGASVIGTTSTANLDFVKSIGADEVIDYTQTRVADAVHDVDVVLDTVGGDTALQALPTLRPGGMLALLVRDGTEEKAKERGARVISIYASDKPELFGTILRQVGELYDAGVLAAQVAQVLPLEQAAEAHRLSEARHTRGHVVLHVAD